MKIATVVPRTIFGVNAELENYQSFCKYLEEAKGLGADLVVFPESFPDNWRPPSNSGLLDLMKDQARKFGIHLVGSILESSEYENKFYNTSVLIDDTGKEIGRYRRTTPNLDPWLYRDGGKWEYSWIRGDQLPVFETRFGTIGILICSEIYAPYLATRMAQKGASILIYPTGLTSEKSPLVETWKTMAWARAIENLCITVVASNSVGEGGLSMICSPEEVMLETSNEGVHISEIDLERLRKLRNTHDTFESRDLQRPYRAKPGILMDWVRDDL